MLVDIFLVTGTESLDNKIRLEDVLNNTHTPMKSELDTYELASVTLKSDLHDSNLWNLWIWSQACRIPDYFRFFLSRGFFW